VRETGRQQRSRRWFGRRLCGTAELDSASESGACEHRETGGQDEQAEPPTR
jgi:hypothetical protein